MTAARRRRRGTRRAQRSLVASVIAVVLGVALFVGVVLYVSGNDDVQTNLADDEFVAGQTDRLAAQIASGGPLLLPDPTPSRARDVYIQHLSADPDEGWLAIDAHAPGHDDRSCPLGWDGSTGEFFDTCTEQRYPADGAGLGTYPTRVDDGRLLVNFRAEARTTTTADTG